MDVYNEKKIVLSTSYHAFKKCKWKENREHATKLYMGVIELYNTFHKLTIESRSTNEHCKGLT